MPAMTETPKSTLLTLRAATALSVSLPLLLLLLPLPEVLESPSLPPSLADLTLLLQDS